MQPRRYSSMLNMVESGKLRPGEMVTRPVEVPAVEITDPNADIVAVGSDFVAVKVILPTRRPTFTL